METTQTFSGYDQSKVDELVRDAIDRAKGYYAYTHIMAFKWWLRSNCAI